MAKLGEKATVTGTVMDGLLKVQSSRESVLTNFRMMLLGPPGEGKTICAMTASDSIPDALPANEWTALDDVFVLLYDNGGLDSLSAVKLDVPHIDLSTVVGGRIKAANAKVLEVVRERVKTGQTKTVVVDSLTTLDKAFLTYLATQYEKWGLYNALLQEHMTYFQALKSLACNVIYICHGKYIGVNEMEPDAQQKRLSSEGLGVGDTRMDVTGQAAKFYRANMSLIAPVAKMGAKGKEKYCIYPGGVRGHESKSRYAGLAREEPAHLQKLFAKIKKEF